MSNLNSFGLSELIDV